MDDGALASSGVLCIAGCVGCCASRAGSAGGGGAAAGSLRTMGAAAAFGLVMSLRTIASFRTRRAEAMRQSRDAGRRWTEASERRVGSIEDRREPTQSSSGSAPCAEIAPAPPPLAGGPTGGGGGALTSGGNAGAGAGAVAAAGAAGCWGWAGGSVCGVT